MQPPDALPVAWQRVLALSGVVFAALFVVGWFTNGGLTPHYNEPNEAWTDWARDNPVEQPRQRIRDAACGLRLLALHGNNSERARVVCELSGSRVLNNSPASPSRVP